MERLRTREGDGERTISSELLPGFRTLKRQRHILEKVLPSHQQVVSLYDTVAMGTVHQLAPLLHLLQNSIIKGVLGIPSHKHRSAKC